MKTEILVTQQLEVDGLEREEESNGAIRRIDVNAMRMSTVMRFSLGPNSARKLGRELIAAANEADEVKISV